MSTNKQFDPFRQADQLVAEWDITRQSLDAIQQRLIWMLGKCQEENDRLRAEREALDVFTEAEFAERLFGDKKHKGRLADMRAEYRLPHRKAGITVLYTRQDIADCMEMFAINGKAGKQLKKAA